MPGFVVLSLIFLVTLTECKWLTTAMQSAVQRGPSDELHSYGETIAWQEWCDGTMAVAMKEAGFSLVRT